MVIVLKQLKGPYMINFTGKFLFGGGSLTSRVGRSSLQTILKSMASVCSLGGAPSALERK